MWSCAMDRGSPAGSGKHSERVTWRRDAPYNRAMTTARSATALYTVEQVRSLDRIAIDECAIPGFELMQRASASAFAMLSRRWPQARRLLVLAGDGNNGGDAFLLACIARAHGLVVRVFALSETSRGEDAAAARAALLGDGQVIEVVDGETRLPTADLIVDGLFGTGLARAIEGPAAHLVARLAECATPVLALDVPSGLDADTGIAGGAVVRADATVSFVGWKRGLFTADARDLCGTLELATLGMPGTVYARVVADAELLDADFAARLPLRRSNVNKGTFGHVLAIGGDDGMAGAVRLAAEAALRVGAGLVSVATRAAHVAALNAARPELMARGVDGPQSITPMIERANAVALGPGLGAGAWGHALWDAALRAGRATVIDADALNLLARSAIDLPQQAVLTPHPGEAARLLGVDIATIQSDRFAAARELAKRHRCVVVLKGSGSLVVDMHGRVAVCPFGNPGMASAGMGDVLTGIIAGLLAQGLDAWDAACVGVVAHARAGDAAAGDTPRGLIASDLFGFLREMVNGEPG